MIKLPIPTESQEQIALFQWAKSVQGKYPELRLLHHIPNGGKRRGYTKKHITSQMVYDLKSQGLSLNKIALSLNVSWDCVKQRYDDFIHDNPELLEG